MAYRVEANLAALAAPGPMVRGDLPGRPAPRTRLMPPRLGPDIIPRPRLARRLTAADWPPLAIATGPAGFGKTTLLRQWSAAAPFPTAWFTADHDDDLPSFVINLLAAVARSGTATGLPVSRAALAAGAGSPDRLADALADDLVDLSDRLLLVIDDYDRIADPAIRRFLARVLRHPPPGCTLAIGSRTAAPVPTTLLRGRGGLVEVAWPDLRFTDDEAAEVLAAAELTPATIGPAIDIAQGWPVVIRLLAAACRAADEPSAGLAVGTAQAADFLLSQVVRPLPPDRRLVLGLACIAGQAPLALVDSLGAEVGVTDAAALLGDIAGETAVVTPDGGDVPGFRCHPLARRAIALDAEGSAGRNRIRRLHASASAWFSGQGMVAEAVAHALAADDHPRAARIVEDAVRRSLAAEDLRAATAWPTLLPPGTAEDRLGLLVAAARVACLRGALADAEEGVESALALLAGTAPADAMLLGEANALAATVRRRRGDAAGALDAAQAALALLPDDGAEPVIRAAVLADLVVAGMLTGGGGEVERVLPASIASPTGGGAKDPALLLAVGIGHVLAGRLDDADAALRRSARPSRRPASGPIARARSQLWLGRACYQRNRLAEAAGWFAAVLDQGDAVDAETRREAAIGAVLAELARGRRLDARPALAALDPAAAAADGDTLGARSVRSLFARIALADGDLAAAGGWLAADDPAAAEPGASVEEPALTRVRVRLALGGRQQAQQALRELRDLSDRPAIRFVRERAIESCALEALANEATGNVDAAEQAVVRLLALAEPGRFVRAVLDAGPAIGRLLARNSDRFGAGPFLATLIEAAQRSGDRRDPGAKPRPGPAGDAPGGLSQRERDVLDGLARRLTDKEIAQELRISPLTVKRHAANLYEKLGAAGRRDAVRKARDLGLALDDPDWRLSRTDRLR